MTRARAIPATGEHVAEPDAREHGHAEKEQFIQVRGPSGLTGALKLQGRIASAAA
jgi:hypothetical protein